MKIHMLLAATLIAAPLTALAAGSSDHSHSGGGHAHMAAIGAPGDPARADRTVEVRMGEMFFSISDIHVKKGETIRFRLFNDGEEVHEFNIGTAEMHEEHALEMMEMMESGMLEVDRIGHGMMMDHDDPNSILLEPNAEGEIAWTFNGDADLEFSCNVPGHRESGMLGKIELGH